MIIYRVMLKWLSFAIFYNFFCSMCRVRLIQFFQEYPTLTHTVLLVNESSPCSVDLLKWLTTLYGFAFLHSKNSNYGCLWAKYYLALSPMNALSSTLTWWFITCLIDYSIMVRKSLQRSFSLMRDMKMYSAYILLCIKVLLRYPLAPFCKWLLNADDMFYYVNLKH